jgi:hypothetical protein
VTQPTLNRRGFIAAITAAVLAGPQALASLLEQHRRPALVFSIDFPYSFVVRKRSELVDVIWSRQVEEDYIAMMRIDPRAPSGFRAWSQRHPS